MCEPVKKMVIKEKITSDGVVIDQARLPTAHWIVETRCHDCKEVVWPDFIVTNGVGRFWAEKHIGHFVSFVFIF